MYNTVMTQHGGGGGGGGDFWGLKIMGTRGEIVDVIHHLSPKVAIIFLGKCGNFTKIWCKVIAR